LSVTGFPNQFKDYLLSFPFSLISRPSLLSQNFDNQKEVDHTIDNGGVVKAPIHQLKVEHVKAHPLRLVLLLENGYLQKVLLNQSERLWIFSHKLAKFDLNQIYLPPGGVGLGMGCISWGPRSKFWKATIYLRQ